MKPTTMLYRNLLAMEAEEVLRVEPGRRRRAPRRLRQDGARPADGGHEHEPARRSSCPRGRCCAATGAGEILGSGSDVWKYWAERRAGALDECAWREIEDGIARSFGTCMTMGTASTMAAAAEALGMTLPGASSIPAADSNHPRLASAAGRRIVEMVFEDLKPRDILTTEAFENAVDGDHGPRRLDERHHPPDRHGGPGGGAASTSTASTRSRGARPSWPTSAPRAST